MIFGSLDQQGNGGQFISYIAQYLQGAKTLLSNLPQGMLNTANGHSG
jgi:hypothetical protein